MNPGLERMIGAAAGALGPVTRAWEALGSPWLRLWRLARLRARCTGPIPPSTQFDGPVRLPARGRVRLELGPHCRLGRGAYFETGPGGTIRLAGHVRVNQGTVIVSGARVEIGAGTMIGEYVSIRDTDHGTRPGEPMRTQAPVSVAVRIGPDVWIARGAAILKGVTVGAGAVIGANSVVTRDVPELAVVGGVPARVLRMRQAEAGHASAVGPADGAPVALGVPATPGAPGTEERG